MIFFLVRRSVRNGISPPTPQPQHHPLPQQQFDLGFSFLAIILNSHRQKQLNKYCLRLWSEQLIRPVVQSFAWFFSLLSLQFVIGNSFLDKLFAVVLSVFEYRISINFEFYNGGATSVFTLIFLNRCSEIKALLVCILHKNSWLICRTSYIKKRTFKATTIEWKHKKCIICYFSVFGLIRMLSSLRTVSTEFCLILFILCTTDTSDISKRITHFYSAKIKQKNVTIEFFDYYFRWV